MDSGAELFLYAGPEMGHIVAEVELSRRLTSLNPHISISILIPKLPSPNEKLDAFIKSLDAELRRDSGQRISVVDLPPLTGDLPAFRNHVALVDGLASLYKPIVKRVVEERRLRKKTAGKELNANHLSLSWLGKSNAESTACRRETVRLIHVSFFINREIVVGFT